VLDCGLTAGADDLPIERVLVLREVLVLFVCRSVARRRANRRGLRGATGLPFGGVGVAALGAVVVAVGQGEVGAEAGPERAGPLVLAAGGQALVLDELDGAAVDASRDIRRL